MRLLFFLIVLISSLSAAYDINPEDSYFPPLDAADIPKKFKDKFQIGSNGEQIISSSGQFTVRSRIFPPKPDVFFARIQPSGDISGSITFCFPTKNELLFKHFECSLGQCGMKLYITSKNIYVNTKEYHLPYVSGKAETIIVGYINRTYVKVKIGETAVKELLGKCSIEPDFITINYERQITFDVHYNLSNAILDLPNNFIVIKGERKKKDAEGPALPAAIVCAFIIPILIVLCVGECSILWTKRAIFKEEYRYRRQSTSLQKSKDTTSKPSATTGTSQPSKTSKQQRNFSVQTLMFWK